ncbi:hypothetical protein C8R43DRAFT_1234032 [Mycena crocata]|nr:hypothetical protein C8R43DRAFT_1234032 [Mycena crocata]
MSSASGPCILRAFTTFRGLAQLLCAWSPPPAPVACVVKNYSGRIHQHREGELHTVSKRYGHAYGASEPGSPCYQSLVGTVWGIMGGAETKMEANVRHSESKNKDVSEGSWREVVLEADRKGHGYTNGDKAL